MSLVATAAEAATTARATSAILEGGAVMLGAGLIFVTIFRKLSKTAE